MPTIEHGGLSESIHVWSSLRVLPDLQLDSGRCITLAASLSGCDQVSELLIVNLQESTPACAAVYVHLQSK